MQEKSKMLDSMLNQLHDMYEGLFGVKYIEGLQESDKSEFVSIIEAFRNKIHQIKSYQEERDKKEEKLRKGDRKHVEHTPEVIKISSQIRESITIAEEILKEAVKRMDNDVKAKGALMEKQIKDNRSNSIKNCYNLLNDVKEAQEGGTYKPPPSYPSLQEIKKKLFQRNEIAQEEINIEEQEAIDKMRKNDADQDEVLDQIIQVNKLVRDQMVNANEKIEETREKIAKNTQKTDILIGKVKKADSDLVEVLKHYRRPNKLCLDITLIFLVLALIGVIINMLKGKSS